jgi:peptidoglycan LD-endopeptidase CwlK
MAIFCNRSKRNLDCMHLILVQVANSAIESCDFTIICSVRSAVDQDRAYQLKRSRARFGESPHNYYPSLAFDFIPCPFVDADWENVQRFTDIARNIIAAARQLGVNIRWGGDFRSFKDLPHFELENWREFIGTAREDTKYKRVEAYSPKIHPNPYK